MSETITGQTTTDSGATSADAASTTLATAGAETAATADQQQAAAVVDPNAPTEAKPEGDAKDGASKTETKAPEGAPEQYADFTMPEGVKPHEGLLGELKGLAKEFNLPQDAAQKLADLGVKHGQTLAQQQVDALQTARETWAKEVKADVEIGGEKFEASMVAAKKAVDTFADAELKKLLNETGLGNHPSMVRVFAKIGQAISNDRFVGGRGAQSSTQKSLADKLYPSSKQ